MPSTTITIRTDPDLAGKIAALALAMDRSRNWVIEEALKQYVEAQMWQIEGITHEQVMAEAEALLSEHDVAR
jgi:predicted transcriptional regulator